MTKQSSIPKLYNEYFHEPTSQLYKLHAKLDAIVLQAYGFKPDDDLLEKLLTLNLELAEKETRGGAIVGPWAPTQQTQWTNCFSQSTPGVTVMEPTISLDAQALKALIKESVREVMREEWFKFFDLLTPYVDNEEQAAIAASFSPADYPDTDFVDITNWFDHENQAQ